MARNRRQTFYHVERFWIALRSEDEHSIHPLAGRVCPSLSGKRLLAGFAADLACSLRRQGIKPGETALVQLGNVAELYITFFALLKLGVAPVLALFSHQRSELNAYASQIEPVVQLHNDSGEHNLQDAINHPAEDFTATPSPADEVAYFQLSGGTTGTPKLIPRTHNDYYYSVRRSVESSHNRHATCARSRRLITTP